LMYISTVISDVVARKLFNSRGDPTINVTVYTESGLGSFSAPSGASKGRYEAVAFPPGGVDEAVRLVDELIAPELLGVDSMDQFEVDETLKRLDGTSNFSKIGGSTAIATSVASAKAAASSLDIPLYKYLGGSLSSTLPLPLGNVIGGGKHSASGGLDIQEILVLPLNAESFYDAALANIQVYKRILKLAPKDTVYGRNDEGAWITTLDINASLKLVKMACEEVSDKLGIRLGIGLDVAASSFWNSNSNRYVYSRAGLSLEPEEQFKYMLSLIRDFNLVYVEDPFHEDDFESFARLMDEVEDCLICGDDLFVTNAERIDYGASLGACNSAIIKPNQVGTLTDTVLAVKTARSHGFITVFSHRSGETVDPALSHLAVALSSPIIKCGVMGGERIAKINELIRIEEDLGGGAGLYSLEGVLL